MNQVAIAMLAHPDDCEILCAGTLLRLRRLGWEIHIATMTAGDLGSIDSGPQAIAGIRTAEARAAAARLGATYHCLGYNDCLVTVDRDSLRSAYRLFRSISPGLVLTHALQDYMEDHEATARIARAAAFIFSAPNLDATLPARPCGIPWLYHCDPLGGLDHRGRVVTPDTLVDVSAVHEEKIALLACHASQRSWLRHHHGTDEYLDQVRRHDHARGETVPCAHAEAFVQHRSYAFPADDLLARLLPHA